MQNESLVWRWIMITTNLPKLRSLASGWGKTATGGEVMSFLWAPEIGKYYRNEQQNKQKRKPEIDNSISYSLAMDARVISSEYPPFLSSETTPQLSCRKSSACIWREEKTVRLQILLYKPKQKKKLKLLAIMHPPHKKNVFPPVANPIEQGCGTKITDRNTD